MIDVESAELIYPVRYGGYRFSESVELVVRLADDRIEESLEEATACVCRTQDLYCGDCDGKGRVVFNEFCEPPLGAFVLFPHNLLMSKLPLFLSLRGRLSKDLCTILLDLRQTRSSTGDSHCSVSVQPWQPTSNF